ncbi:MAG TPA: SGNH/GDSL hydrolase family protein, partial [Rhodobacteraceae bacterium]|nr:SGNH/GDSL hydrolase family protein [Paracoccaceae bacterium]
MGDSLLSAHAMTKKSVSDSIEAMLGEQVVDRSVPGARIVYALPISGAMGMKIEKQFTPGDWDWVVLNGGGNDLLLGCGCVLCKTKLNRLISYNGKYGEIPRLVSSLRRKGARVIYVGYLRSPGLGSPIEHCKKDGDELERRIDMMAQEDDGIYYLSLQDLVPYGDRSYHGLDMIHPSVKASTEIG